MHLYINEEYYNLPTRKSWPCEGLPSNIGWAPAQVEGAPDLGFMMLNILDKLDKQTHPRKKQLYSLKQDKYLIPFFFSLLESCMELNYLHAAESRTL